MAFTLPYDDNPDIGETERAKRRRLSPRGTGTGTPAIEEGVGTYRPGSTFSQSMRGGQQQPGTGNVLGLPPQENFVDRAKTAVLNTAQGMNNMVDAGQNALAQVQRPDVAPARPPEGTASRNTRAYADKARADLAAQAGMPTTARAPVPVTQAAPAGYQPGQAFAQNMQQTPAVMPSPPVAMQPAPAPAPWSPPAYIRAAQATNDAVDAVQGAFTSTPTPLVGQSAPAPAGAYGLGVPMPQQQIAQAPPAQAPYQPPPVAQPVVEQPAATRTYTGGPITASPVTYAGAPNVLDNTVPVGAAAGAIGGPYPGPNAGEVAAGINLPAAGEQQQAQVGVPSATHVSTRELERMAPTPEMERTSLAAANPNWNHRAMEDRAPVTDESFGLRPKAPGEEIARDRGTPYPGATARGPVGILGKIQETALTTLGAGVEKAQNEPWRQDAVRSRAETRAGNANMMQFFSDEAQRNQRAAAGPSYNELEQAKSAARYADMTGIGKRHAAARLDALQKAYSDANAPAAHRDYVGQQIAQTASVDQTSGLQQAQRHAEQTHPLAIAKGAQDIAAGQQGIQTAQTAEQAAQLKMQMDQMHFNMRRELADHKTPEKRKKEIQDYFDSLSDKPAFQYHAVGGGEIDNQKQPTYIGGGNVRTGEIIGPKVAPGQAIGAPPAGQGTAAAPVEGAVRRDKNDNVQIFRNGQWVDQPKPEPKHRAA